ncbi:MAG: hypothetical protein IJH25_08490 [Clostridia bacterium]|nr:hypothetical protein [Clostridia bacterium]MBQ6121540.1 hypothetical protein [Clostridia bacterium]
MINLPKDYAQAKGYDGSSSFPRLTAGGHICRTRQVVLTKSRAGNDMLEIHFDIVEEGEFKGYYQQVYAARSRYNPDMAWPGRYFVLIANPDGTTNGRFKGFINAVEESNGGYKFDGNELGLQNKLVGFNFGEEEYEYTDRQTGEIKVGVSCKPQYAASVARVREGLIPPAKKLLNNGNGAAATSTTRPVGQPDAQGFQEVEDDELPF